MDLDLMDWTAPKDMIAMAIGRAAMDNLDSHLLIETVNSAAMDLIMEIQEILNDHLLEDPERFQQIDSIVSAFRQRGIDVYRHDFG